MDDASTLRLIDGNATLHEKAVALEDAITVPLVIEEAQHIFFLLTFKAELEWRKRIESDARMAQYSKTPGHYGETIE